MTRSIDVSQDREYFAAGCHACALCSTKLRRHVSYRVQSCCISPVCPYYVQGKPVIFNQALSGGRSISTADVADICVKVLDNKGSCNKAFNVYSEADPDEMYDTLATPVSNDRKLTGVLSVLDKHI